MDILIVDDSQILRERLKKQIKRIVYIEQVREAENSEQTFTALYKSVQDVVFPDIRLSGKNGIELLRFIKSDPKYDVTQCIMFANDPYPQFEKKCMEFGVDYFLNKSNDYELVPAIKKRTKR